ncbi:MAG: LacI family DNA-binding transcriptional regulator [Silicimonas sp.]|nr:LacI family DNA-binding transcriptional regulator [Silicimonas sp.]
MANPGSVPTLEDVAKAAGVSTATVSRCLNTPDRVVERTRTKVMEVIEALGYTPNFAARVMAAKRSNTIGAIVPTMENAIFARGLQAFQEQLYSKGYTLIVASSAYQPDLEKEQIRTLVSRGADGLLLIGSDRDPALYDFLNNQKIPALIAWTFDAHGARPTVGFDNRKAMTSLVQEVLAFGHRDIAVISGVTQGNDRARQRVEGVKDALLQAGHDPDKLRIVETRYEVESGAAAFEELMTDGRHPTAIICGNDVLAVGAIGRARAMGIDVPGDVSITGFDDIELAKIVSPSLTTVQVPHRKMGRKAARALIDMVENNTIVASVELKTKLKLRGSLGPAPVSE